MSYSQKQKSFSFSFILISFMFFGWFFGIVTLGISLNDKNYIANSIKTSGTIIKKNIIKSCNIKKYSKNYNQSNNQGVEECADRYGLKYSYNLEGKEFEGYSGIEQDGYITISNGDKIVVYHNNDDNNSSKTQFNINTLGAFAKLPIIALTIAAISTLIFLVISHLQKQN